MRKIQIGWWSLVMIWAVNAQAASEFIPIQERAQGQALAGGSLLNDSIYSNPAASAFLPVYSVEGTYLLPKTFAVSVLDTKTSGMGGGLGYFRQKVGEFEQAFQGVRLAFSGKVSEGLAIGVTGKMLWGPDFETGDGTEHKDIDTGLLANLGIMQFGLSVRNILGGKSEFQQQREMVLGARYAYQNLFYLSAAAISKTNTMTSPYQVGFGAEYISPYFFGLKGGFRRRIDTGTSYWSAGASFLGPKLLVHYAAEFPTTSDESIEHTVAAALLF